MINNQTIQKCEHLHDYTDIIVVTYDMDLRAKVVVSFIGPCHYRMFEIKFDLNFGDVHLNYLLLSLHTVEIQP